MKSILNVGGNRNNITFLVLCLLNYVKRNLSIVLWCKYRRKKLLLMLLVVIKSKRWDGKKLEKKIQKIWFIQRVEKKKCHRRIKCNNVYFT